MSKKVFFNLCLETLKEHFNPRNYEVKVEKVNKNNIIQTGISVVQINSQSGMKTGPVFYPDQYYSAIKNWAEVDEVLSELCKLAEDALKQHIIENEADITKQFTQQRDLRLAVVGYEANREWLAQCPHKHLADMAVYVYSICEAQNGVLLRCRITNDIAKNMNLRKEELFLIAEKNTERLKKWFSLSPDSTSSPLYVLSTSEAECGAGIIACANVLKEIHTQMGTGFYILPSSIHEVLLLPIPKEHADSEALKNMVCLINRTELVPEDILTDQVYYFDGSDIVAV